MSIIDQFRDPVFAVAARALEGRPKLAAAVADVDVDAAEADTLPDSAYAWPEKRAFPLHSREHAILSRMYREASADPVPEHVDTSIKEACDVYEIPDSLFERVKVAAGPRDDSGDFLLPDVRRLRVTDASQVKEAEHRLAAEGRKLSPGHRMLASSRLVEKAAMHGVRVSDETRKMAGLTVTDTGVLADWLEARREAAPDAHKDGFQKLANEVKRMGPEIRDRATQTRLAEAVEQLDEAAGLDRHWDRKLPDPVRTVFNTTKVAGPGIMIGGRFMPMERLAAYGPEFFSDILGPDFVREASDLSGHMDVQKLATVIGTLPADMQRALALHMR